MKFLSKNMKHDIFEFEVRRDFLLEDILKEARRPDFDPMKSIKVMIVEGGLIVS